MEYFEGKALSKIICAREAFGDGTVIGIMEDIRKALCGLHGISIAHRDVKPENVVYVHLWLINSLTLLQI